MILGRNLQWNSQMNQRFRMSVRYGRLIKVQCVASFFGKGQHCCLRRKFGRWRTAKPDIVETPINCATVFVTDFMQAAGAIQAACPIRTMHPKRLR